MKRTVTEFYSALPLGMRLFLAVYALAFPLALIGMRTQTFDLYGWLALSPQQLWRGQVWRLVTYGFLPAGMICWAVNLFWFATLVGVLKGDWSGRRFWGYCLLAAVSGAVPVAVVRAKTGGAIVGDAAIVYGLLVAWDWLHRNERLLLLGIGEISVRQAVVAMGLFDTVLLLCTSGWFLTLAMLCGGLGGWLFLFLGTKRGMSKKSVITRSERVARLEL